MGWKPVPQNFLQARKCRRSRVMKRFLSIDIMRATAIILMTQVHFASNLAGYSESTPWLARISYILGCWPAPTFTFLSGLSLALWLGRQREAGQSEDFINKFLFRRGLFIFVTGIVFAFFVWLPKNTFDWNILTLIGSSVFVLAVLRKLPPVVLVVICLLILLISPPLRTQADYFLYWLNDEYEYNFTVKDILLGYTLNGYFPILPWIVIPIMGFVVGRTVFKDGSRFLFGLPLIGACLAGLAVADIYFGNRIFGRFTFYYAPDWTFYPASTTFILGVLGINLLLLWTLHCLIDQNKSITGKGPIFSFFRRFSFFSLTVYLVHHVVHIWPLRLYALWMGDSDLRAYEGWIMNTGTALALVAVFVAAIYPVLIFLERHKKYSFEHLLRWFCE
jgi:uncharacterized membrane protein